MGGYPTTLTNPCPLTKDVHSISVMSTCIRNSVSISDEVATGYFHSITRPTKHTISQEIPSEKLKSLGSPRGYEKRRGGRGSMPELLVRLAHSLTNLDSTEAAWVLIGQVAVLDSSVD